MIEFILNHAFFQSITIAAFGGLALSLHNLYEDSQRPKSKRVDKDVMFVFFFIIWPFIGAGLCFLTLLEGSTLKPVLAFSIGLAAPTTLKAMAKSTTAQDTLDGKEIEA